MLLQETDKGVCVLEAGHSGKILGDGLEGLAHGECLWNGKALDLLQHLPVGIRRVGTQFPHFSCDDYLAGVPYLPEIFDGDGHAARIGVVSVEDDGVACRFQQLRAHVRRRVSLYGGLDVQRVDVEIQPDGSGRHGIVEVVAPDEFCAHVEVSFAGFQREHEKGNGLGDFAVGEAAVRAVCDDSGLKARMQLGGLRCQQCVAPVHEQGAVAGVDGLVQGPFGADDVFLVAESLQVGAPDVGDDAVVRLGDVAQCLDFSRVVGAHFYDSELRFGGHAQQGQWHADMIVEIAFGGGGPVFFRQDGVTQFFGCRLAVRARDTQNGNFQLTAVVACQLL